MTKPSVPYLFYSYSDNYFPPGTLVMASYIDHASDAELLRLGRRVMDKYELSPEHFLASVKSNYGYGWIVASGTTIIFISGKRMRTNYRMCMHSRRIGWWRRKVKK